MLLLSRGGLLIRRTKNKGEVKRVSERDREKGKKAGERLTAPELTLIEATELLRREELLLAFEL